MAQAMREMLWSMCFVLFCFAGLWGIVWGHKPVSGGSYLCAQGLLLAVPGRNKGPLRARQAPSP